MIDNICKVIKKVQRKEDELLNDEEEEVIQMDFDVPKRVSFRDMVLNASLEIESKEESWAEDDIELIEEDVKKEIVDGVPSIDFSERVYSLIEKSMARMVVVKLLKRTIRYNTLWNKACSLWKLTQRFQLMDVKNDYFLAKFESIEDYTNILSKELLTGSWQEPYNGKLERAIYRDAHES
ncbi:hypothetical protein J1N35_026275 [Gossypium stocksii]|uniref:DUF4283 domain-containing protein n=1 Tax=Gossypium stocksii TaxID=47602 RepID=A0A9D3V7P9_9ROSI|nr:hypothetical protein J1N35_026275 [Gossypium stocksii]